MIFAKPIEGTFREPEPIVALRGQAVPDDAEHPVLLENPE